MNASNVDFQNSWCCNEGFLYSFICTSNTTVFHASLNPKYEIVEMSVKYTSQLLGLPAELRNKIYRLALLSTEKIEVSDNNKPKEPSLLMVNKQIRKEAIGIYYSENHFRFVVKAFNSAFLQEWFQGSKDRINCQHTYKIERSTNLANLLGWIKAYYDRKTGGHIPGRRHNGAACICESTFRIVKRLRNVQKLSWDEVEEYLEDVHQGPIVQILLGCKKKLNKVCILARQ